MSKISIVVVIALLLFSGFPVQASTEGVDFEFTNTENEIVSLSDYYSKPMLIEWGASWCSVCKNNQEAIKEIYPAYNDDVTFISISVSISDDSIEDVIEMKAKGNYPWIFGLDTSGFSGANDVFNGFNWLLDANGHILKQWNYTIVTVEEFASAFETYLNLTNTYNSEGLVVGNTNLTIFTISLSFLILTYQRRND